MMIWLVVAGVLAVSELLTGTFYVLIFALGCAAGGLAAYLGLDLPLQLITAGFVAVLGSYGVYHWRKQVVGVTPDPQSDPNINLDVGQTLQIDNWVNGKSRTLYRGAQWDVELKPGSTEQSGMFRITAIRGSTLVVTNN